MEAFKFLDRAGVSTLTGYRWPLPSGRAPGPWVEAVAVRPCHAGIHACTEAHLAYWIAERLWVVELDGETLPAEHKIVAGRGRLVRRVDSWHSRIRAELAADVAWRSRDLAVSALRAHGHGALADRLASCSSLDDVAALRSAASITIGEDALRDAALLAGDCAFAAAHGKPAEAPFVAACAAGHATTVDGGAESAYRTAFHAERDRQSRWMIERLDVAPRRHGWWRR